MGIMDFIERYKAKKERFKQFEEEQRMMERFEEKKKSSNERELERFMKEAREDTIKKELEEFRKDRQHNAQYGNQITKVKNMFANDKNTIIASNDIHLKPTKRTERGVFFKNGK